MDCPGCGLQTSILALLRGEWYHSFAIYPATVPILLMFIYLALHLRLKFKQGDKLLVYAYFFCAGIIFISYIYKIVNTNLN
jgi:hypothetical protein